MGDGPLRESLEDQAKAASIQSSVAFLGQRTDAFRVLSEFDIFVLPSSEREGLGISMLEAMSCGLPVIATNVGGIPEVVRDGVNGFLVPPKNPHMLAERILRLLRDKNRAKSMGEAGKKILETEFTSEMMIGEIEKLYEEAI
jgi:glycosyltransferase involved in cell wall biosynthesis